MLVRDLLGAVLVDDVVVGGPHRVRVAEVDLVLAWPGLALRVLDDETRAFIPFLISRISGSSYEVASTW